MSEHLPSTMRALPRSVVILLGAAAAVVAVFGIQQLAWLVGPAFFALMLVVAVSPIRRSLIRWRLPNWLATTLTLLAVYLILIALAAVIVLAIAQLATMLPTYSQRANELWGQVTQPLIDRKLMDQNTMSSLGQQIGMERVLGALSAVLTSLTSASSMLILVLLFIFFMGLDATGFSRHIEHLWQTRPSVAQALTAFAHGTRRYLAVSTVFGIICAILDALFLQLLHVPLPWLWGILAFITNYIPSIGFFVGLVPPAMLALLTGGPQTMLLVIACYMGINLVVQTGILPKYVGDVVGLNVTTTFIGMAFWAWALGPLGALLAIPLTLLVKAIFVDVDPDTRWVNALISSADDSVPPRPEPDAIDDACEETPGENRSAAEGRPAERADGHHNS